MNVTELIAFLEREEIRERKLADRWRSGGTDAASHVARHELRGRRFAASVAELRDLQWRRAQGVDEPGPLKPRAGTVVRVDPPRKVRSWWREFWR
ncbi:MAG: hypothetical protein WCK28_00175 [Burkholderiales bacterium]|jgi:hypothetical protein